MAVSGTDEWKGQDMASEEMILATIDAFWKKNPGGYLGRTKLQKICYFARELGVPYDLRYRMYYYGPYSAELDEESVRLQLEGLISDESNDPSRYSNYKLTPEGEAALSSKKGLDKWLPKLELVAKVFGSLENNVLELLATVKFLFDRIRKGVAEEQERRRVVVRKVLDLKGEKFDQSDAERAYDSLMEAALLAS